MAKDKGVKVWSDLAQECNAKGIPFSAGASREELEKLLARPKKK